MGLRILYLVRHGHYHTESDSAKATENAHVPWTALSDFAPFLSTLAQRGITEAVAAVFEAPGEALGPAWQGS